jgi:hypothetical protein
MWRLWPLAAAAGRWYITKANGLMFTMLYFGVGICTVLYSTGVV